MTKPAQIQRYANNEDPRGFYPDEDGAWIKQADHVLALLQVREMLEAKAKEWDLRYGRGRVGAKHNDRADELRILASTIGEIK